MASIYDGYADEVRRRLYGGVHRDDLLLSETAVITRSGQGAEALVAAMEPGPRPEPTVIEFGRGPTPAPGLSWQTWAVVVGFLAMAALWVGICVYGVIRGLQELERVL